MASAGKMGRGVFAGRDFKKGELIERCPLIPVGNVEEWDRMPPSTKFLLPDYVFQLGTSIVIALGYGSLYNHSSDPGASYKFKKDKREVLISAARDIPRDSQIFIDYGWNEDDLKELWTAAPSQP